LKKYLCTIICIIAILTAGCGSKKAEKNTETIAKNLAIYALEERNYKIKEYSEKLENTPDVKFRYVQIVSVNSESMNLLKKYELDTNKKKKCAIVHFVYKKERKHIGSCK
jgi:fructose-bisphosphate aldolase class 1